MAFIEKEAKQIQLRVGVQHQLHTNSTPSDSSRSSSIPQQSIMVGAGDVKLQMMDMLTSDRLHLQIIPIVGMGGSVRDENGVNIMCGISYYVVWCSKESWSLG
ncbi:uncharacterized protein LOC130985031 [Salvia miltiorrhiza]|uniref:uncharacterized protein LOC130985031 n=1 Tax=Salvia miltiorrhiza TaxID=226208 RepID=UPI0025AD85D7|nr:uncharacterized protein LOC130985031 [Salvia miltiorrhiza]